MALPLHFRPRPQRHTGPVNTFADFVVHVPTRSTLIAAVAAGSRYAPAISSEDKESEVIATTVLCGTVEEKRGY
jgi:hypothetical protein